MSDQDLLHGPWAVDGLENPPKGGTGFTRAIIRNNTGWEVCSSAHFDREQHAANANLIASAPAMHLILERLAWSVVRIEQSSTVPSLSEVCFNGIRYPIDGDWNATVSMMGWDRLRESLAKARGES